MLAGPGPLAAIVGGSVLTSCLVGGYVSVFVSDGEPHDPDWEWIEVFQDFKYQFLDQKVTGASSRVAFAIVAAWAVLRCIGPIRTDRIVVGDRFGLALGAAWIGVACLLWWLVDHDRLHSVYLN